MRSETQSYDFNDSQQFLIGKRMLKLLDQEQFQIYDEERKNQAAARKSSSKDQDKKHKREKKNVVKRLNKNVFPAQIEMQQVWRKHFLNNL